MPAKRVNTATLIRGRVTSIRVPVALQVGKDPMEPLRFENGKPEVVEDPKILKFLEDMYEEIQDGEGEVYEKPTFRIDRNVPMPETGEEGKVKRTRLSSTRKVKKTRRR